MINPLLWRASLRYLWRHPWQMMLTLLGVTLGVAVVVSVDLANESASRAFRLSMDEVSGRATHQIIGGPTGLDEQLYTGLRVELGMRETAPIIEAFAEIGNETLRLLGVDPLAEDLFRGYLGGQSKGGAARLLSEPNTVMMAERTARRLGLHIDQPFSINLSGRSFEVVLTGYIAARGRPATVLDGLVIGDIATVQELTGTVGSLSWIDLILAPDRVSELSRRIRRLLPAQASLIPATSRTDALLEMVRAFQTNLSAMSLLALIVGLFLIYNTMTFTVLQRRGLIGTLRVLGVTRREIFSMVLWEAGVIGLAGSVIGILAGLWLAQGLVHLVTRTINELYFVTTVSQVHALPGSLLKGLALGCGAALLSALIPALEATRTAPQAALRRSVLEGRAHRLIPRLAWLGLGLCLLSLLLLWVPSRQLVMGFVILFMMILGMTLVAPLLVWAMARLVAPLMGSLFGVQGRLAIRGVDRALSRTGVAIAALMLAVSTTVGVGIMVQSFRDAVQMWLESTLRADIYISSPGFKANRTQSRLDPDILEQIRDLPGIEQVTTGRTVTLESEDELIRVFALGMSPGYRPHYRLKEGEPAGVWRKFDENGAVVISESLAFHREIEIGEQIALRTDQGVHSFPVVGIYYNYSTGPGLVLMNRKTYDRSWTDRDIDALGVYLKPAVPGAEVMKAIRERIDAKHPYRIRSNREIRQASMQIFDRTFTITKVLRLLVMLVAFVGILSALMALQLERAREFAVLRASGFTPLQIWKLVILQTGFMGVAAGILSLPVGVVLAELLIHVINQRAFGWSMSLQVDPRVLIEALALAVVAALLAGLYPAWRMTRTAPTEALRQE